MEVLKVASSNECFSIDFEGFLSLLRENAVSENEALKQFMRSNRSPAHHVATARSGGKPAGVPLEHEREGHPSYNSQDASPIARGGMNKFDIFDNIDEERLQEFEHMIKEADVSSTYDAFVKKKKRRDWDESKFMTALGVVRGPGTEGVRVLH
jgi:hypothetical protein